MNFDSSHIVVNLDGNLFSADRASVREDTKVSALPLWNGGFDRRILGSETVITLEGRYIRSQQAAFFRSIVSSLSGGASVDIRISGVRYYGFFAEHAALTETEDDPGGKYVFVLRKL